MHPLSTGTKA